MPLYLYTPEGLPNHEHVCVTAGPLTVELDLYVESFANIAEANMVSHMISIFGYEFTFLVM